MNAELQMLLPSLPTGQGDCRAVRKSSRNKNHSVAMAAELLKTSPKAEINLPFKVGIESPNDTAG
jgi:hypothetical protein